MDKMKLATLVFYTLGLYHSKTNNKFNNMKIFTLKLDIYQIH